MCKRVYLRNVVATYLLSLLRGDEHAVERSRRQCLKRDIDFDLVVRLRIALNLIGLPVDPESHSAQNVTTDVYDNLK